MLFWMVLAVIIGALSLLAWWVSGPRFNKSPSEALPPSHSSPGLPPPGNNTGAGLG